MRRQLSNGMRALWRTLPVPIGPKLRFKQTLFTSLPWAFRHTRAYRDWAAVNGIRIHASDGARPASATVIHSQAPGHYVPLLDAPPPASLPVRLIAFYLPQFHAIPENDAWWGEGFTEWTKVRPSLPLFVGHEQPHVPGELGYYHLTDSDIPRRQIELARRYGVGGFCFYYYWFAGKRLLDGPVERFLQDTSLDFPFCLCWANENWSRRWDGLDQELLIAQDHSDEDDLAFIAHISRFLRDPRYLRVDGKPVVLLYRPSLLPSARDTAMRWRRWCREHGVGEIYLVYPQSFDSVDPAVFGFDAAVEFPPNNSGPPVITDQVEPIAGHEVPVVYDLGELARRSAHYRHPSYTLFRGVCPAWDNTARKSSRGAVFLGSSAQSYQEWLSNAAADTCRRLANPDERMVFVNAWNEWAEGAHLEPDLRQGYAYLQATRNALTGETHVPDGRQRVVLVSHDAHPHGAQFLALNLARTLTRSLKCEVHLVCLGAGPLKQDFAQAAQLHDLDGHDPRGPQAQALVRKLHAMGARVAIVNTTVSGLFLETLATNGVRCIALIHELKGVLEQYRLQEHAQAIALHARQIICPADSVARSFEAFAQGGGSKLAIRPQGLYKRADRSTSRQAQREALRQLLGLPPDAQVVLGAGYADARKGVDLFVEAALQSAARHAGQHWVWIGHWESDMQQTVERLLARSEALRTHVHFPGLQRDTDPFYLGADLFALTSREDPFPSVVLEAMDAELPVVGFQDAGGFTELAQQGVVVLVPHADSTAFSRAVDTLLGNAPTCKAMGDTGRALVDSHYSFRSYAKDLLNRLGVSLPRVSVIVPNFNYQRYLDTRLGSILGQTVPIHELIFLDDCSSDDSIAVASDILSRADIDFKIVRNDRNSGSVFRQWQKGIELATGDHVWIAEADDESEPAFLETVLRGFSTPGIVMSYCESQMIDAVGMRQALDYSDYVRTVDDRHWRSHFANDGRQEVRQYMSIMNTIPNVSAVVFKREPLRSVIDESIDEICHFRVAGDWRLYIEVLARGGVSFNPTPLNRHRRHEGGVTLGERMDLLINEIRDMQAIVSARFEVPTDIAVKAGAYLEALKQSQGNRSGQST